MSWNLNDDGFRTERPASRNENSDKDNFLQQKVKESLETRLNYWKNKKNSNESCEDDCRKTGAGFKHRKSKSHYSRKSLDLKDLVWEKLSTLDQVHTIIERVLTNFPFFSPSKPSKEFKESQKNLEFSLSLLTEEQKNSHFFLKLVESLIVQHNSELSSLKTALKTEYESKLSALEREKQEKNFGFTDSKVFESLQSKINSLEHLLTESDRQVLEKIEEINEKSAEIQKLKSFVSSLTNDLQSVKSDMKEVENFWLFQQETFQKQSQELFEDLKKVKKEKEIQQKSHEKRESELQSSVESYKSQFSKAYEALARADIQLESLKLDFASKEKKYQTENQDLTSRVETLEKSLERLRNDLEIAQDRIEARDFIVNQCKQEEVSQLQTSLSRVKQENLVLHKHNKDLSTLNQKLEDKLVRLTTEKVENLARADKKGKKSKK